jgi:hypothetical protein
VVALGCDRALVQKALHGECHRVRARRAPRPGWNRERQLGLRDPHVRQQQGGELVGTEIAAAGRLLSVLAEGDEMIRPRDQLAVAVETALERMEAADPVEVVLHVVFAGPL